MEILNVKFVILMLHRVLLVSHLLRLNSISLIQKNMSLENDKMKQFTLKSTALD